MNDSSSPRSFLKKHYTMEYKKLHNRYTINCRLLFLHIFEENKEKLKRKRKKRVTIVSSKSDLPSRKEQLYRYPLLLDTRGVLIRMQMNEKIRFEKGRQTLLRTSSRTSQVTEYRSSADPAILDPEKSSRSPITLVRHMA